MEELDLQQTVLVGFSMVGGEVVRYLLRYGSDRVSKIVLISAVTPFMLNTNDNPEGIDASVFGEMKEQIKEDRINFLDEFGKKFFGINLINKPVSGPLLSYYLQQCSMASPRATENCAESFAQTDFRSHLKNIDVPVLVIHGDADKTVPIESSGERTAKMIADFDYIVYDDAPHELFYTNKEQLNLDLIDFIRGNMVIEMEATTKDRKRP